MCKSFLFGLLLIFLLNINFVFSQSSGGAPGGPGQAPSPGTLSPIIVPSEDLDQFENSSLRESNRSYREGQSTLTPKRKSLDSNVDVNAQIEKSRQERDKALEDKKTADQTATKKKPSTQDDNNLVNGTTLFRWTDKQGVTHVTDNLSSVPQEYRDQVTNPE